MQVELVDYGMNSVSEGIDAMAITRVVIRPTGQNVQPGVTPQVHLPKAITAPGMDASMWCVGLDPAEFCMKGLAACCSSSLAVCPSVSLFLTFTV